MLDFSDDEEPTTMKVIDVPPRIPLNLGLKGRRHRGQCFGGALVKKITPTFGSYRNRTHLDVVAPPMSFTRNVNFYTGDFIPNTHRRSNLKIFDSTWTGFNSPFQKCGEPVFRTQKDHPDSFSMSTKTVVRLAQYFAVLPVTGSKSIKFRWFHYKNVYWCISLFGTLFYFVCYLRYSLLTGIYTKAASKLVSFGSAIISSFLMLHFGLNWRHLRRDFVQMESKLAKYGYPAKIGFKFKVLTVAFLFFGVIEFLLSKFTILDETLCDSHKGDAPSFLNSFFMLHYREVFEFHAYNTAAGFLMLASNFRTSTVWVFQDLFLGFVSWTIAERFKQIHDHLNEIHGQKMPITFWREMREDYNDLTLLTKKVDTCVQKIMFLAMGNDLFFLCMTLFNSLQSSLSPLKLVSLFWSFLFLLLRTVFIAFSAAKINDESKEPKTVLYSVPHDDYSSEVRRFLTQLTTNEVALTGCGFFPVTRSLILTIMGTVLTYEIVLVQFIGSNDNFDFGNNQTCLE